MWDLLNVYKVLSCYLGFGSTLWNFSFLLFTLKLKQGLSQWPKQKRQSGLQYMYSCILTNSRSGSEKKHNKIIHCKLNLKVKTEVNKFKKESIKLQLFPPSWLTYCDKFPDRFIWFCSRSVVSLLECSDTMCNN